MCRVICITCHMSIIPIAAKATDFPTMHSAQDHAADLDLDPSTKNCIDNKKKFCAAILDHFWANVFS